MSTDLHAWLTAADKFYSNSHLRTDLSALSSHLQGQRSDAEKYNESLRTQIQLSGREIHDSVDDASAKLAAHMQDQSAAILVSSNRILDALHTNKKLLGNILSALTSPIGVAAKERLDRGIFALENGWADDARDEFTAAVQQDRYLAEGHLCLGLTEESLGSPTKAVVAYLSAIRYSKPNPRLQATSVLLYASHVGSTVTTEEAVTVIGTTLGNLNDCAEVLLCYSLLTSDGPTLKRALELAPELGLQAAASGHPHLRDVVKALVQKDDSSATRALSVAEEADQLRFAREQLGYEPGGWRPQPQANTTEELFSRAVDTISNAHIAITSATDTKYLMQTKRQERAKELQERAQEENRLKAQQLTIEKLTNHLRENREVIKGLTQLQSHSMIPVERRKHEFWASQRAALVVCAAGYRLSVTWTYPRASHMGDFDGWTFRLESMEDGKGVRIMVPEHMLDQSFSGIGGISVSTYFSEWALAGPLKGSKPTTSVKSKSSYGRSSADIVDKLEYARIASALLKTECARIVRATEELSRHVETLTANLTKERSRCEEIRMAMEDARMAMEDDFRTLIPPVERLEESHRLLQELLAVRIVPADSPH